VTIEWSGLDEAVLFALPGGKSAIINGMDWKGRG
jgi:hypothetical protein